MNVFIVLSTIIALILYIPLCTQLLKGETKQNLATWILWTALDAVACGTIIAQQGNYLVVLAYTIGGAVTSFCIFKSKHSHGHGLKISSSFLSS